eukprot:1098595-Pleurochrysis_carterae.AAC.5
MVTRRGAAGQQRGGQPCGRPDQQISPPFSASDGRKGDNRRSAASMTLFRPPTATATVPAPASTPPNALQGMPSQRLTEVRSAHVQYAASLLGDARVLLPA